MDSNRINSSARNRKIPIRNTKMFVPFESVDSISLTIETHESVEMTHESAEMISTSTVQTPMIIPSEAESRENDLRYQMETAIAANKKLK